MGSLMPIPPDDIVYAKLTSLGADVNSFQVNQDRTVMIYDASYESHAGKVPVVPALFIFLCVSGGGFLRQETTSQALEMDLAPGDICIVAPSSPGSGMWPDMPVIAMAIEVNALHDTFGDDWARRLRRDVISKSFKDALVETTMMQVGYTNSGNVSDGVLLHAAQLVVHQLLDEPHDSTSTSADYADVHPLSLRTVSSIAAYVGDRIDQHISVEELAGLAGVSKHHFTRRFKAATGSTPYQFVMAKKLDRAAESLSADLGVSVTDVSQSIGYDNPAQFAKAFRRRFGQAPRSWRMRGN